MMFNRKLKEQIEALEFIKFQIEIMLRVSDIRDREPVAWRVLRKEIREYNEKYGEQK